MKLNSDKSKVMLFNKSQKFDFMPEVKLNLNADLEVVEECKLLGIVISSDLKWTAHTKYLCMRGYTQLWSLRRIKKAGANTDTLLDYYIKHIRSILEYATPVWGQMLTAENCEDIERIQKSAFTIIFGLKPYRRVLKDNKIKTLKDRRLVLCQNFATKSANHPIFSEWFAPKPQVVNTRYPHKYKEVPARTDRWMNSPIPIMTRYLNT